MGVRRRERLFFLLIEVVVAARAAWVRLLGCRAWLRIRADLFVCISHGTTSRRPPP
jgi:hypothetical protein